MPRSRNIKPGLCQNPELAELPIEIRFLFAVLPMFADREGRLEDRPKKIKMLAFPADSLDIEPMLRALHDSGFIQRYTADEQPFIQIVNFGKHQHPHQAEADSTIPAPCGHSASTVQPSGEQGANPADSLNLIPDALTKDRSAPAARFPDWWKIYPKKRKRKDAEKIWKSKKLDELADELIADTKSRMQRDASWQDKQFIPDPTTYLKGERWQDDIVPVWVNGDGSLSEKLPKHDDDLVAWAKRRGLAEAWVGESFQEYRNRLSSAIQKQATHHD